MLVREREHAGHRVAIDDHRALVVAPERGRGGYLQMRVAGIGNERGDAEPGAVHAGDLGGDRECTLRRMRVLPGEQDLLEHQAA